MQLIIESERHVFVTVSEHLGMTPLKSKELQKVSFHWPHSAEGS